MAGTVAERSVAPFSFRAAGCVYSVASRADEPALRELLRANSLGGWIRLAFQREPDAFAGTFGLAHSHDFIIACEEKSGRAVGLCERYVRDGFVNGEVVRLPYLGSLRVNGEFRNRIRILRQGFVAVRDLLGDRRDAGFSLTAITADNDVARRVLCAGVSGFPQYLPVGEMLTFAVRTRRARVCDSVSVAGRHDFGAIAAFLQRTYREYQFAPVWRADELERLDATWLVIRDRGRIVACMALWDQSAVKQTVIHGYSRAVAVTRPLFNAVAPLLRAPRLPASGTSLKQIYLSHVAVAVGAQEHAAASRKSSGPAAYTGQALVGSVAAPEVAAATGSSPGVAPMRAGAEAAAADAGEMFGALMSAGLSLARERGFDVAVIGLAERNPLVEVVRRRWKTREYRSLLNVVQWPGRGEYVADGAARVAHPEIALM